MAHQVRHFQIPMIWALDSEHSADMTLVTTPQVWSVQPIERHPTAFAEREYRQSIKDERRDVPDPTFSSTLNGKHLQYKVRTAAKTIVSYSKFCMHLRPIFLQPETEPKLHAKNANGILVAVKLVPCSRAFCNTFFSLGHDTKMGSSSSYAETLVRTPAERAYPRIARFSSLSL